MVSQYTVLTAEKEILAILNLVGLIKPTQPPEYEVCVHYLHDVCTYMNM